MKITFTPAVASRIIRKIKDHFNQHPLAPAEWKLALTSLPVYGCVSNEIHCNNGHKAMAMSWILNKKYGAEYKIDPNEPMIQVGQGFFWPTIEFDVGVVSTADAESLYNLTAHELAHSLDYRLRGQTKAEDHDPFWGTIFMFMGGHEEYRFPNRNKLQTRINKSIARFGGERVACRLDY